MHLVIICLPVDNMALWSVQVFLTSTHLAIVMEVCSSKPAPGGCEAYRGARQAHLTVCIDGTDIRACAFFVPQYAAGGELFDRIVKAGRFSEDEARFFFQQLVAGVDYCHSEARPLDWLSFQVQAPLQRAVMRSMRSDKVVGRADLTGSGVLYCRACAIGI